MSKTEIIRGLLQEKILVVDGAMGTVIQSKNLKPSDFGGSRFEGCNENLVLTCSNLIREIHESYLEAGADIIETNTFGATSLVLAEYALESKTREINQKAAQIACEAARAKRGRPRFVAGAMGPTTKSLLVGNNITFDELVVSYSEQAQGLLEGGVDILLIETAHDPLNVKAALLAIDMAFEKLKHRVPLMVSCTIEAMGTMLTGQAIDAFYVSLAHRNLLSIGMNCATGPDFMTDRLRTLSQISHFAVSCMPNAGLPDEHGAYHETPESFSRKMEFFVSQGWVNVIGGCCGTTPKHIAFLREMARDKKPRAIPDTYPCAVSGLDALFIDEEKRAVLVGERTSASGSKNFRNLIAENRFEEAAEIGRRQIKNGAQILDVCLASSDRDECADMGAFLNQLTRKIKAPLMIDSIAARVVEVALKICPGKAIINSINLEEGEERIRQLIALIKRYGASIVAGVIDENKTQGMAVSRERKLEIAQRLYILLTEKYEIQPQDIIFDLLVFPIGTGDKNYIGSAAETIEAIRLLKQKYPKVKTILGISNVSFGLPPAGREILNAVFLHHCVKAGLDLAIVNTEKLAHYSTLPEEEKLLAENVLFWQGPSDKNFPEGFDPVLNFIDHFREKKVACPVFQKVPLEERVSRNVIEGSKEGLIPDLGLLLETYEPLEIINGPLMKGMDEVGKLFAANEMIVVEVLQSAEVMKTAVSFLEPQLKETNLTSRAKIILASVKGDVHDIGKNLVHIIFKNNGYEIIDLGIKVTSQTLIENIQKYKPDIIGLSGLLVKSAQEMVNNAQDLKNVGIDSPLVVGGAALSAKFVATRIAPAYSGAVFYAKDAMHGLEIINALQDPKKKERVLARNKDLQGSLKETGTLTAQTKIQTKKLVTILTEVPQPPDLKVHVEKDFDVAQVFSFINPIMLYGRHLGLKGNLEKLLAEGNPKALEVKQRIEDLEAEIIAKKYMEASALYRFFPANSEDNSLLISETPNCEKVLARFDFPRQAHGEGLCLADLVRPTKSGIDFVAFFVVTCGKGIRELAHKLREEGKYLKSYALEAIALESAEALAELLHEKIRAVWKFPDPKNLTLKEKFQAKYRGKRYSFGYPPCPNLEDQVKLFALLEPERRIGVRLTENFMMEPEASVSALVLHHPQASYFSV